MKTYRTATTARRPPLTRTAPGRASQKLVAKSISLPAPVGGWNARDGLADMDKADAVSMVNYWPNTTTVQLRLGYTPHSASLSGQVETLMAYSGGTTDKLFAATSAGYVYDTSTSDTILTTEAGEYILTEAGEVIVIEVNHVPTLTGLSNGRWQYANFTTAGGSYICMVNGVDYYRVFDGTNWHKDTDGSPYNITGVDSRTLIGINVFKNRLWFVQTGTLKAWYLPVDSIGGAAAALDMSSLCQRGGYLMAMGTWTLDAGYGVDDYAVWITNRGEVLVWRMTDPTDPNAIFLIGVWWIGEPVGRRCMEKWRGDLLVICQEGLVPLSQALQSSRLDPRVFLTDKIQQAISASIDAYGDNFGWQVIAFPRQNMLVLNVPVYEGSAQQQYVMNTITKSWAQFTGWQANCWVLYQDELYFGTNNLIGHAWDGYADISTAIDGDVLQAFNYFGTPGMLKRFTAMRPTLFSNAEPEIQGDIKVDFDLSAPTSNLSTVQAPGALWDDASWDIGLWNYDRGLINNWQGATGVGYAGAVRLASSTSTAAIEWVSTEVVIEGGAIL